MDKRNSKIWAPVIGLDGFRKEQTAGRDELLFNELHGERLIDKPHKHDFFIINLFDKASGVHTIDSIDHVIKDHQVHVLFPGQMHKWHVYAGTIGYQLMIERSFFEHFAPFFRFSFTNYQNHPVIDLTADAFAQLHYEFESVKQELKRENSLIPLITARAGVIAFYAEKLHISPNYLNILCKKNLKISATQLIHQRISIEAKRLLQSTERSIKEIAFELGFADQAYFSNFFKQQTGASPSDFRENIHVEGAPKFLESKIKKR